jgi:hypothetical protein
MDKPDPGLSRIKENFMNKISSITSSDELESLKRVGDLIFTEEDINATSWPLDRLLRQLFVENNITDAYFDAKYEIYSYVKLGLDKTKASNNRSNILKAIRKGRITYTKFLEVVSSILGYSISNMMYVFDDPVGGTHTIELKENRKSRD